MYKSFAMSLGLLGLFLVPAAGPVEAAELQVHGSSTVYQAVMLPKQRVIEERARHRLQLVSSSSGGGLESLIAGRADIAMTSAPLRGLLRTLRSEVAGPVDGRGLIEHRVGETRVAFAVNPLNPVRELSLDQVFDILAGKIANWQEVGGQDAPIQIVTQMRGSGVRAVVESHLLARGAVIGESTTVQTATMAAFAVAQLPNALGITTVAAIDNQTRFMLRTNQQISQPLFLVTRDRPNTAAQTLINAVRDVNGWTPEPQQAEPRAVAPAIPAKGPVSGAQERAVAAGS